MAEDHQSLEVFRTPLHVYADFFAYRRKFWRQSRVLDPSAGDGRMVRYLVKEYGNKHRHGLVEVRRSERRLLRRIPNVDWCVKDFLDFHTNQSYDAVVTNPPFSRAYEFVDHAMQFVCNDGMVCVIQKLQWLGTQKRSERHKNSSLFTVLVIPYRITWEIDGRPNNVSDNCEYAWFCYRKGYSGHKTVDWLL